MWPGGRWGDDDDEDGEDGEDDEDDEYDGDDEDDEDDEDGEAGINKRKIVTAPALLSWDQELPHTHCLMTGNFLQKWSQGRESFSIFF